jgi:hypothetical protein
LARLPTVGSTCRRRICPRHLARSAFFVGFGMPYHRARCACPCNQQRTPPSDLAVCSLPRALTNYGHNGCPPRVPAGSLEHRPTGRHFAWARADPMGANSKSPTSQPLGGWHAKRHGPADGPVLFLRCSRPVSACCPWTTGSPAPSHEVNSLGAAERVAHVAR